MIINNGNGIYEDDETGHTYYTIKKVNRITKVPFNWLNRHREKYRTYSVLMFNNEYYHFDADTIIFASNKTNQIVNEHNRSIKLFKLHKKQWSKHDKR